jgi:exonuclease III
MDSTHLSMLNWNVRGLNDAAHRELVRETVISSRPSLVCLQETKLAAISGSLARDTLGPALNSYLELGAQGTRGGILLAWDKELVSVTNAINRAFTITATV